jgi:predicted TPR repeat methyltransferase
MTDTFLDKAYGARDAASTRKLYDDWAASYEAELGGNGYATPGRCAAALAQFTSDPEAPVLDFGCGTGLSGHALKAAGFETLDGMDLSADMLEKANDKGIYRKLIHIEAGEAFSHNPGDYAAIAAIGVIGVGAAPISVFDQLMEGLGTGGLLVFSFNDHALEDPANEARVNEWVDCGSASLLFREHGDHIPGIDLKSNVYVIEKK